MSEITLFTDQEDLIAELQSRIKVMDEAREILLRSEDAKYHLINTIGDKQQENFYIILLNSRNRVVKEAVLNIGTTNSSMVDVKTLAREMILFDDATQLITAHNHPSGDLEPSNADIRIFKHIIDLCELLGFNYLDNQVVSKVDAMSFREENYF